MPEFFNVLPPADAVSLLLDRLPPKPAAGINVLPTADALGRVTAEAVRSPESLPAFHRSTMDGFSLRAADTYGASDGLPA